MKKSSALWRACEKIWSECVRLKAGGMCQFCGKRPGTGAHHIIKRDHLGTAFVVENGLWGCSGFDCHNHDNPALRDNCIEIIGQSEYDRLWELARTVTQLRESDLLIIKAKLLKEKRRLCDLI